MQIAGCTDYRWQRRVDGRLREAVATVRKEKAVNTVVRIAVQALLFVLAVVVFFLGLGIGLALNPALGTLLWITSGAIVVLNLVWIVKGLRRT
jgi:hypothetical protein